MSDNKGKDGEHGTLALLSIAALKDNRLEVMRFSETNVPDMGQDIFLKASNRWVRQFGDLTSENYQPHERFSLLSDDVTRSVRIDVKTCKVIDKTLMEKAAADIKKHPKTDTHIIFGGRATKAGKDELDQIKSNYPSKEIFHVSDNGIKRLASELNIPIEQVFPHLAEKTKDE